MLSYSDHEHLWKFRCLRVFFVPRKAQPVLHKIINVFLHKTKLAGAIDNTVKPPIYENQKFQHYSDFEDTTALWVSRYSIFKVFIKANDIDT